jgi:hypothetical protein
VLREREGGWSELKGGLLRCGRLGLEGEWNLGGSTWLVWLLSRVRRWRRRMNVSSGGLRIGLGLLEKVRVVVHVLKDERWDGRRRRLKGR